MSSSCGRHGLRILVTKPFDNRQFSVYILLAQFEIFFNIAAGFFFCGFLLVGHF